MEHDPARETLRRLLRQTGIPMREASLAMGRNANYLQQFLRRGSPATLRRRDREVLARLLGCTPADLLAPVAGEPLRRLVAFECARARELLEDGRTLVASLRGFGRLAVTGFVAGGLAGLDAIEAAGFEVLSATRSAGARRLLRRAVPLYLGAILRRGPA